MESTVPLVSNISESLVILCGRFKQSLASVQKTENLL